MAIVNNVETGDAVSIFYENKIDGLFKNAPGGSGVFLNWHPDNRHVLFRADSIYSQENHFPGLWLVDTDTGAISVLVPHNPPEAIRDAVVSPDGQESVYSLQPDILQAVQPVHIYISVFLIRTGKRLIRLAGQAQALIPGKLIMVPPVTASGKTANGLIFAVVKVAPFPSPTTAVRLLRM